ncbi:hypothetical protein [Luteimonas aquatica]|uniref:hypothetical protein n=1 Tax=Luteimonas aquatica TaxID=450364 RepID=UPI001F56711F|nr:hypothetical protein [Luteimonas aquatica]
MYRARRIESSPAWSDPDGVKLYTISAHGAEVDRAAYLPRLARVKASRTVDWPSTPAFAIFHDGASLRYLVLGWWGNGNELFTSVSVETEAGWVEDAARFSFCLWDMDVMWFERNCFVDTLYRTTPDLAAYRARRHPGA